MEKLIASLVITNCNKKKQVCPHPALKNCNFCVVCNQPVKKSIAPATIRFGYLSRDLSLTPDAIQRLRQLDFDNLLKINKLHLLLDLDLTLIHAIKSTNNNINKKKKSNNDGLYDILKGEFTVKLRPGALDFLNKASELFVLSVYTMADQPYAKDIAKLLGSNTVHFSSVISREYFTKSCTKSLDIVLSHPRVTLIVDDSEDVWATQDQGSLVKIKPYNYFKNGLPSPSEYDDQELARVWSILKNAHNKFFDKKNQNHNYYASKDVRQLL